MNRVTWLNLGGAALALALSIGMSTRAVRDRSGGVTDRAAALTPTHELTDATYHTVKLREFSRIASASALADPLLLALCEPGRVIAFSDYSTQKLPSSYLYSGKQTIRRLEDVESILALKPDLVLINDFGAPAFVSRLRASGVEVFDLGEMRGLKSLFANIQTVATLVGHPERGEALKRSLKRRLRRLGYANLPAGTPRRQAIYLSSYGARLFGGTTGTSYHDLLEHGGLEDAAAERYANWPEYSKEQVLALAPEVIVTRSGEADRLCQIAGFDKLPACRTRHVIEIPIELLDDPGPLLIDAAELVFEKTQPIILSPSKDEKR